MVLAEWRSTISVGASQSRYFKLGSSEEIWEASRKNLENICPRSSFTPLAVLMVAFLPTRHLRNKKGNEEDEKFYKRMIEGENGDWNRLFDALPSSVFWKSGFLQLFSQCAKHDVSGRILWPEYFGRRRFTRQTFQLSSSSSGDGRHGRNNGSRQSQHLQVITSSVRSIGSPATKIAPRVLDTGRRAGSSRCFYASVGAELYSDDNIGNIDRKRRRRE